jgi:HK97 family phage major capsid protein
MADTKKFEELLQKTLQKVEERDVAITELEKEIAFLKGRIEEMPRPEAKHVYKMRGIEVPWESKDSAKGFMKFANALAKNDHVELKAMAEGSAEDGGHLVPDEYQATLLRIIEQFGVIRNEAQVIPMPRLTMEWPVYTGAWTDGVAPANVASPVYWIDENTDIPQTWPQFSNVTMTAKKLAALIPTSGELLQDSAIPIASLIAVLVGEFMAKEEDRVGFVGDTSGTDPYDGCLTAAGNEVVMPAGAVDFTDMTAEDLLDMQAATPRGVMDGARYYMHRSVFHVIRKLKSTDGIPVYNPPASDAPATIWGYPYTLVESMPALVDTAVDTRFVLFGNLKNFFMGDRMALSAASTDIVGFAAYQTHFRFIERIAFRLALPNSLTAMKTAAS